MKRWWLMAFLTVVILIAAGCAGPASIRMRPVIAAQPVVVDVSLFYDELAPYGTWVSLEGYGWVWTPYDTPVGWRPYSYGYWAYTDYGWTWVSKWRWGWAPFHYGRWFFHSRHGWVWKPGTVWGPAWVVWRHHPGGAGWIGWAPMPPQIEWRAGIGLRAEWGVVDPIIEPFWYSFVEERNFPARDLDKRLELPARNGTLLGDAQNVTNYAWAENRVVNRSLSADRIEQATGRQVARQRVMDGGTPSRGAEIRGNDVILYRPRIERETTDRAPGQAGAPKRSSDSTVEQARRREVTEQRRLETGQAREREALQKRQQTDRTTLPRQTPAPDLNRQHENERRALEEQMRREQQILKNRQEEQRRAQPAPPARQEKERKPAPERKPPDRKPDQ